MGAVIGAALAAGSTSQRIVDIALSLHKKDFAALDAWSLAKGVFAGNILRPEPLSAPLRCSFRPCASPTWTSPHGHGDGSRFG